MNESPQQHPDDDMEHERNEYRRLNQRTLEKMTAKVEALEIQVAVLISGNTAGNERMKELSAEFYRMKESYSQMTGHLKLQSRIFGWVAGLLIVVIGVLFTAYLKK